MQNFNEITYYKDVKNTSKLRFKVIEFYLVGENYRSRKHRILYKNEEDKKKQIKSLKQKYLFFGIKVNVEEIIDKDERWKYYIPKGYSIVEYKIDRKSVV